MRVGEYLGKQVFIYSWPQAALTVDIALLTTCRKVLLIERAAEPCKGRWALPGGFVDIAKEEQVEEAAYRELEEETSVSRDAMCTQLVQVGAYAGPHRDVRGYSCTFAFAALVDADKLKVKAGDDARRAQWFPMDALPELAFDHAKILSDAVSKLEVYK